MKAGTKHLSPDKPAWQSSQDLQGKLTQKKSNSIFFFTSVLFMYQIPGKKPQQ